MRRCAMAFVLLLAAGCAQTELDVTYARKAPVCDPQGTVLVLWGPDWRADQKDMPGREVAAQRGIERFFAGSRCFQAARVVRSAALAPTPSEVQALAAAEAAQLSRVLFLTVRELGPTVTIGPPYLIAGGTEVVLDLRGLTPAGEPLVDFTVHWRDGGPFVIKGVATLEDDIGAALAASLDPRR